MHKVFISYHHSRDQRYKDWLVNLGECGSIFVDRSVDTGDISDHLSDADIRVRIRDHYLRDSTVTIVLVGKETKRRKHIDWEIYSSMYDGSVNKKSGIVVINLPEIANGQFFAPYGYQKKNLLYPNITSQVHVNERADYEHRFPYMPDRIIDNLLKHGVTISVTSWDRINPVSLRFLIDSAFRNRLYCQYDLSRPMRRANS